MEYHGPWDEHIVPAGLLQFPIYDYSLPHYINFGSMGSLLAHYLVHAVDKYGSRYDKNGDYSILGWWTDKTKTAYNSSIQCFTNCYNNKTMGPYAIAGQFSLQTVKVNGQRYSLDAIAIASGIKFAFKSECFNRNDKAAYNNAIRGRVSEDIATNGALSHVKEFAKAFRCPINSPMNPAKKCTMFG